MTKRSVAFVAWFLVLWLVFNWALYELCFPRSVYAGGSYGSEPFVHLLGMSFGNVLVVGGGLALFLYFRNRRIRWNGTLTLMVILGITTILLSSSMALGAIASVENKAKLQWYIDDLRSQGFEVTNYVRYPYNHGLCHSVYSYSNFTSIARDLNCTYVLVCSGTPSSFMFFFSSNTALFINEHGQYLFFTGDEK